MTSTQEHLEETASQRPVGAAKRFLPSAFLVCLLSLCLASGVIEPLNTALMDLRFRLIDRSPSDTLVLVEIDPPSLRKEQRWPWPRDRYGKAVANLQDAGASLIAFDVDFSSLSDTAGDDAFVKALARRPGEVVLPVFWQWSSRSASGGAMVKTPPNDKFLNDVTVASVTLTSEKNGVVRRGWRGVDDDTVFRAAIASVLADAPTTRASTFLIDYSIDPDQITRLSFHDVYSGNFPAEAVRGKKVLIGATALELGDEFASPVRGILPGVVFHALSYESMVQGRELMRPHKIIPAALALALLLWLASASKAWSWKKFTAFHAALLTTVIGFPIILQSLTPITVDVGALLYAQFLCAAFVIGVRLHRYAAQIIRQRAATAHYQALTSLVVRDNSDGVIVTDLEGRIELCNERALSLLNIDRGLDEGSLVTDWLSSFPLYAFQSASEPKAGEPASSFEMQQSELQVEGPNGLTLEIIGTCSFAQTEDGSTEQAPATIVYTMRDISARKRIEEAEREAKEAAIAADKIKSQLISNMSHELRTPLNGIIGFADILKNESFGPLGIPEYKDYAKSIHSSGARLLTVFNDMLHIAKLDSGEFDLCIDNVLLDEVIESSVVKLEVQAEEEGKNLRFKIQQNVSAKLDVSVIREIMTHLISNALKYTKEGGHIIVRAASEGSDIVLQVLDNGCGASPDCLPHLTEAFYQADAALNRKYEGAGLGLYVVSKFVELHGGSLSFESRVDKGFLANVRLRDAVQQVTASAAA